MRAEQRAAEARWQAEQKAEREAHRLQDVCTKTQLRRHGGPGYAHLLTTVAAELAGRGHGPELLRLLLVETPRRLLSWA